MKVRHTTWVGLLMLLLVGCGGEQPVEEGSGSGKPDAAKPLAAPAVDVWTAVVTGNVEVVKLHLESGTDPNIKDPNGAPILNAAAVFGHRDVVAALLEQGADVAGKDGEGNGALHAAAFLGRFEVVELLLEKGADANVRNNKGETPMNSLGTDWGTTQFIAGLLQIQIEQQSVEADRGKSRELLAKRGGRVGGVGEVGGGGLIGAIRKQDVAAVKRALSGDADSNQQDAQTGVTALSWASLVGNVEIARLLIEKRASINGKNRDGATPLHCAVFMGHPTVVELLLDKGADLKVKNLRGDLPASGAAADAATTGFIAGLLQLQYDTATLQKGRAQCLDLLNNGTGARELSAAVRKQDVAAVKQLLAKSKNANSRDPDLGITVLAWAAYHGHVEIAGLLIAAGADVNGKNDDGSRPLHAAAFTGHAGVLELLLKKGAMASARNADLETPLQMTETDLASTRVAAGLLQVKLDPRAFEQGRARCIELLKQKPATP